MNKQNTQNRKRNLIIKVILGFIIGISFGFGVGKIIKSDNRLISSIEETIKQNCDCESVEKDISSIGIHFSKEDGISNQTASFTLTNCEYKSTVMEEAQRINEHLNKAVENYDSIDLIELTFESRGETELVQIKNGIIF